MEYKIIEKMKKIMDSHLKNNRLEIDKEGKHLIFPLFLDVASFLEEIHKCIMCDLNVNELNYVSNINHPYSCTVTLTHDNIFCDIEKKVKNEKEEKTVEQKISDEVVKLKIFDKPEIDEDDDPLKELLLMNDVKKRTGFFSHQNAILPPLKNVELTRIRNKTISSKIYKA